jgi:hypothetical protein
MISPRAVPPRLLFAFSLLVLGACALAGDATQIRIGAPVAGSLTASSPTHLDTGRRYSEYLYRGRSGERLTLTMRSDDFDAYLYLGRRGSAGWVELASDDDGGDGTNAQLVHDLDADGDYYVRASSYEKNATGDFTLVLESTASPPPRSKGSASARSCAAI